MSNDEWNPLQFRFPGIQAGSKPPEPSERTSEWDVLCLAVGQAVLTCLKPVVVALNSVVERLAKR